LVFFLFFTLILRIPLSAQNHLCIEKNSSSYLLSQLHEDTIPGIQLNNTGGDAGRDEYVDPENLIPRTTPGQKTNRLILTTGLVTIVYIGTLFYLNESWYGQYPRSRFHFYNDNNDWLQMDKAGHLWTSYQEGLAGVRLLRWSGVTENHAVNYGSFLGLLLLTPYEILDGMSAHWGFSTGDMAANLAGSLIVFSQEKLWHEQRISIKFSSHREIYPNDTSGIANLIYGTSITDRTLKDYNGQTYWVSINLRSFFKEAEVIPRWFNIAFGYGINFFNYYDNNNLCREYYFSLDVDFTKIRTKSKILKTVFAVVNCLKVPFPSIEYNKMEGWKFHPFYF
jgi:hypothetical protein